MVLHDITLRKRAEEYLKKSERKYRQLFESSRDAIMSLDPLSWRFLSGNSATLEIFGLRDLGQLTALSPWDLSPERQPDGRPSREAAQEMISTARRQGYHQFEWRHKKLDGEEFSTSVLLTRMEEDGQEYCQAIVRDITDLKIQQQKLELILEAAQNVSFVIATPTWDGKDFLVREFVPGSEKLFGYTRDEVLGRPVSLLHSQEDVEKFPQIQERIAADQSWHGRGKLVRKNGEIFPAQLSVYPFKFYEEQAALGVSIDISELDRTQQ